MDSWKDRKAGDGIIGLTGIMPPDIKPKVRLAGIAGIGLGVFHLIGDTILPTHEAPKVIFF